MNHIQKVYRITSMALGLPTDLTPEQSQKLGRLLQQLQLIPGQNPSLDLPVRYRLYETTSGFLELRAWSQTQGDLPRIEDQKCVFSGRRHGSKDTGDAVEFTFKLLERDDCFLLLFTVAEV